MLLSFYMSEVGHPYSYPHCYRAGLLLVHVEFLIQLVHGMGIHDDQYQEHIDRSLLRKPEAEFETEELDSIQLIHEQDAEAVGDDKPDNEIGEDQSQVGGPIVAGVFFSH
eukprot:gnl/TRDRNA2_/TRDRNA2_71792_c0_seq1.p1 gnl/TRDRNA2_/TRDRNA2_71792_c0~~gnl/TRDRNA2_/TRDRNA2_71792_c0_seq1.p1  ORF type:complete len:110 (+),score=1.43 gnl/TRDRNA2_/TRDRNA2_71792_c0_seq1:19-348(+)